MTKDLAQKIKVFDLPLPSSDVDADTKKQLYSLFAQYGMSQSTAYLRIFSKGFDEWEFLGIDSIKQDFLRRHAAMFSQPGSIDEDGNTIDSHRNHDASLLLNSDDPGAFYAAVKEIGLSQTFKDEMNACGMSPQTTLSRFRSDEWKPWERMGVRAILTEFADNL